MTRILHIEEVGWAADLGTNMDPHPLMSLTLDKARETK